MIHDTPPPGLLRLVDLARRHERPPAIPPASGSSSTNGDDVVSLRLNDETLAFYDAYARDLGISREAVLRLVLLGVMTVIDDRAP